MIEKHKPSLKSVLMTGLIAGALALPCAAFAEIPAGYPADYGQIVEAAKKEGKVSIGSTTEEKAAKFLISDFQALYPGVEIEYNDLGSSKIYDTVKDGSSTADVLWSSATDLQMKLVIDGFAMQYASPEASKLPDWAVYKDTAYGTTYEPAVIAYNKRLLPIADVPKSHADLVKLLKGSAAKYKGKFATYDPEKSGLGYMLITQDQKQNPAGFADMAKSFGGVSAKLFSGTGDMMKEISKGDSLFGYNMLGAYVQAKAKLDPSIGLIYPKDYCLVGSRVIFIAKNAKNPNAAKLWLDYVLSKRGQTIIAEQAQLFALRSDVAGENTAAALSKTLGSSLKPLSLGSGLIEYLDDAKKADFIGKWKQSVK
jgi:iron(III) transport system substrate-binding protein